MSFTISGPWSTRSQANRKSRSLERVRRSFNIRSACLRICAAVTSSFLAAASQSGWSGIESQRPNESRAAVAKPSAFCGEAVSFDWKRDRGDPSTSSIDRLRAVSRSGASAKGLSMTSARSASVSGRRKARSAKVVANFRSLSARSALSRLVPDRLSMWSSVESAISTLAAVAAANHSCDTLVPRS